MEKHGSEATCYHYMIPQFLCETASAGRSNEVPIATLFSVLFPTSSSSGDQRTWAFDTKMFTDPSAARIIRPHGTQQSLGKRKPDQLDELVVERLQQGRSVRDCVSTRVLGEHDSQWVEIKGARHPQRLIQRGRNQRLEGG